MKKNILIKLQDCNYQLSWLIDNYENNHHYDPNYQDYLEDRITKLQGKILAYEELLKELN